MTIGTPLVPTRRLESLDVLRGLTIASMLLVNNPGTWSTAYPPLLHADWNGWTFTDLVFPFFLFMVGMAMMFSFPKRLEAGDSKRSLFLHVVRRSFALMVLGWWGATWSRIFWPGAESALSNPDAGAHALVGAVLLRIGYAGAVMTGVVLLAGTERVRPWRGGLVAAIAFFAGGAALTGFDDSLLTTLANVRFPGVLVRIGACYLLASAIYFKFPDPKAIAKWLFGLLAAYFVFMLWVPVPGFGFADLSMGIPTADTPVGQLFANWAYFIDYHVLGDHTWSVRQLRDVSGALTWSFDPEGLISTIPAVGTVLCGILAGMWMRRKEIGDEARLNGLFVAAAWMLLAGLVISIWMPINKNLWTSSYVVFTAGMALLCLAVLYHLVDLKGKQTWALVFRAYGRNAILAFVLSGMMATALGRLSVSAWDGSGTTSSWKAWSYDALAAATSDPTFASFLWGMLFVSFWAAICWVLDRQKLYFKV